MGYRTGPAQESSWGRKNKGENKKGWGETGSGQLFIAGLHGAERGYSKRGPKAIYRQQKVGGEARTKGQKRANGNKRRRRTVYNGIKLENRSKKGIKRKSENKGGDIPS